MKYVFWEILSNGLTSSDIGLNCDRNVTDFNSMSVVTPAHSTSYVGSSLSPPLSDFNSASSDEYREKFVNLKFLVKEQQKQLESKRVQCEALETIQGHLAEERMENSELNEKNKKLLHMLAILHDRLVANGLSTRTEFDANDTLVPPSRQLLEHLIEENNKLQKKLEYLKVDPTRMENLYKEKLAFEQELQKKTRTVEVLTADNQQLRATLSGSTDDKDAKIVELQREVDRLRQSQDTQDVICQSLSDETITLKERLHKTKEVCQHLVRQLEQMSAEKQQDTDDLGLSLDKITMSTSDENLVAENERLQLECLKKDEEIFKLTQMNTRWQAYNDERNNQMALQQRELEEAKRMIEVLRQQGQNEQQLLQQKAAVAEDAKQKMESENRQLRSVVEHSERQQQQQNDIIISLRQQVQALADANVSPATPCNHSTQIVHMEAQLKVYQEDFECERRDRELAQTKISELENELSLVTRQLDQFQGEYMQRLQHQRQTAITNYGNAFREGTQPVGCHHPMVSRGLYQCDAAGDVEEDGEDEIDGPRSTTNHPATEENIQCPSCKKEFPRSRHDALLEHIDECCD